MAHANATMDRRDFLKAGGLLLGFAIARPAGAAGEFRPNAWLRIDTAGQVAILVEKAELGQGIVTTLAMMSGRGTGSGLGKDSRGAGCRRCPESTPT